MEIEQVEVGMAQNAASARRSDAKHSLSGYSLATATRAPRAGGSPTRSRCLIRLDIPLPKIGFVPVLEDAAMVRMPRVRRAAIVERARKCTDGVEVNATANAMVAGQARAEVFELVALVFEVKMHYFFLPVSRCVSTCIGDGRS